MSDKKPQALTIATSDSGGGAGIQADTKAIEANGVFALSVLVALTAQNTKEVLAVHPLPQKFIAAQLHAVFEDFEIAAVKTGMLFSKDVVETVADRLQSHHVPNLVVDPVMIAKSGAVLLQPDAIQRMKERLIPLALVVTPNVHEAERLAGFAIRSVEDARRAAEAIHKLGCRNVLVKGGHLEAAPATDLLFDGSGFTVFPGEYIPNKNAHGTGCTYSAAIAAHLALGKPLVEAVRAAKAYVTEAIRHGLEIGHGHGPVNHFYFLSDPKP